MEQGFIDILKRLIDEQGKEALLNPAKCKAFLADYTRGEYKKESRLLLQAIEAGAAKAIDSAEDIALCKKKQIKVLHEEYFLVDEVASDVVDTLALVLRGDTSKTNDSAETAVKPQKTPQKQETASLQKKTAKPGLTKWKEYEVRTIAFDTEIEIIKNKGRSAKVEIPSYIEGLPVTAIGNRAFVGRGEILILEDFFEPPSLKSVTIPNTVTSIGEEAFSQNKLNSVIIPNSVTYIGDRAFSQNKLTSVIIPNSVTRIGDWAFSINKLNSVIISNSVTHVGDGAFSRNKLTSIIIPNSVTYIGKHAFHNNQLNSVSIPNSITYIGEDAFTGNQLTSVTVPAYANVEKGAFDEGVTITRK